MAPKESTEVEEENPKCKEVVKMPADDLVCRIAGCDFGPENGPYRTSAECTTYMAKNADLRMHLDMDHPGIGFN